MKMQKYQFKSRGKIIEAASEFASKSEANEHAADIESMLAAAGICADVIAEKVPEGDANEQKK